MSAPVSLSRWGERLWPGGKWLSSLWGVGKAVASVSLGLELGDELYSASLWMSFPSNKHRINFLNYKSKNIIRRVLKTQEQVELENLE